MTRRQPRRPSSNSRCESSFSAASEASSSQVSTPSCDGSVDFVDGSYTSSPICDDYLSDSVWDSHSAVIPWTPANSSAGEPTPTIALNLCPAACKAHQNLNTEKNHDDIESLSFRATTISSLKHDLQDAASLANDEAIASVLNICAFEASKRSCDLYIAGEVLTGDEPRSLRGTIHLRAIRKLTFTFAVSRPSSLDEEVSAQFKTTFQATAWQR